MYKKQVRLFKDVIILMIIKVKKKKNRSHKCNINKPRPRPGHIYTKHKKDLIVMVVICIKQYLSNI